MRDSYNYISGELIHKYCYHSNELVVYLMYVN